MTCQGGVVSFRVSHTYSISTCEAGVKSLTLNTVFESTPRTRRMTRTAVIFPAELLTVARNVNDCRNLLSVDVCKILIGPSALMRCGGGKEKIPASNNAAAKARKW